MRKFVENVKKSKASHYIETYPRLVKGLLQHHVPALWAQLDAQTSPYLESLQNQPSATAPNFHSAHVAHGLTPESDELGMPPLPMFSPQTFDGNLTQGFQGHVSSSVPVGFTNPPQHAEVFGHNLSPVSINSITSDIWHSLGGQEGGEYDGQDQGWMQPFA